MRKLIVSTFLTLDGVAHGGWSVNYWDDQMGQVMGEAMSTPLLSSFWDARPTTSSPHIGRVPQTIPAPSR
jgi:hypothetical protein